jgi:hypothetical protein
VDAVAAEAGDVGGGAVVVDDAVFAAAVDLDCVVAAAEFEGAGEGDPFGGAVEVEGGDVVVVDLDGEA